jgi:hypothetical protein
MIARENGVKFGVSKGRPGCPGLKTQGYETTPGEPDWRRARLGNRGYLELVRRR